MNSELASLLTLQLEFTNPVHCYDGVLDFKSQRVVDNQQKMLEVLRSKDSSIHTVYYPVEEEYVVFSLTTLEEISARHNTKGAALLDAFCRLFKEELT